jgi:signal transduction histidine kinase
VRAHGGTFGAANRSGGGARFWFSVPCTTTVGDSAFGPTSDPIRLRAS